MQNNVIHMGLPNGVIVIDVWVISSVPLHKLDGFAPFSSLASRETFLDISDAVAMAPGPGYYDQKASHSVTKGAGHMDSKVCGVMMGRCNAIPWMATTLCGAHKWLWK